MIYFDYSANTPIDSNVLDIFVEATRKYTANANSNHSLGKLAKQQIDNCSSYIADYFNCNANGIIYTSSASESNNLVIKGIADKFKDKGNHIIISAMEHSSVIAPCNFLSSLGYNVSVISTNSQGIVDLDELKTAITDKTILVSICTVNSELGTIQPIREIANIVKEHENCVFHTDATQAIGKININFSSNFTDVFSTIMPQNVDFVTFTPHKFYGLNGIGVLVNRNNIPITPLIHGGKSTTVYRSGSPDTAGIIALQYALKKSLDNLNERYSYVKKLNELFRNKLSNYSCIHINSPINAVPHILNFSLIDYDANKLVTELSNNGIYVSSNTACSLDNTPSNAVLSTTGDINLASNTIRISLSHLNTEDEISKFFKVFDFFIK